ncbi:MAG: L-dehydroascorbate transporter large permease subunit, partial [Proteobacteria bacterium]|nr:L-dehydroascorbate transporter large permease subunit [Candidatus Avisuccinivibrio stercorigallinarum]
MEVAVFLSILLLSIAVGVPIAFALMLCGLGLMFVMDMVDPLIIAQNI